MYVSSLPWDQCVLDRAHLIHQQDIGVRKCFRQRIIRLKGEEMNFLLHAPAPGRFYQLRSNLAIADKDPMDRRLTGQRSRVDHRGQPLFQSHAARMHHDECVGRNPVSDTKASGARNRTDPVDVDGVGNYADAI